MSKAISKTILYIILLSSFSHCLFSYANAQTVPVEVRIEPQNAQVALNQTVDLAVEVIDVQGLYGFDVSLSFDPTTFEVVDADPELGGVQVALGTFPDPGVVLINDANNEQGFLRFAMTQLNPSLPKNGDGSLIVIKLRARQLAEGSLIDLQDVQIAQGDGTKIETTLRDGRVVVVQTRSGATDTPKPTQGPGTPLPTRTPAPATPTPLPPTATIPGTLPSATPSTTASATATASSMPTNAPPNPTATETRSEQSVYTSTAIEADDRMLLKATGTPISTTGMETEAISTETGSTGSSSLLGGILALGAVGIALLGLLGLIILGGLIYFFYRGERGSGGQ